MNDSIPPYGTPHVFSDMIDKLLDLGIPIYVKTPGTPTRGREAGDVSRVYRLTAFGKKTRKYEALSKDSLASLVFAELLSGKLEAGAQTIDGAVLEPNTTLVEDTTPESIVTAALGTEIGLDTELPTVLEDLWEK